MAIFAPSISSTAATNSVATAQTTTSTTYADLATTGPAVTITTGAIALVFLTVRKMNNNTGSQETFMSFAVSGASTVSAADTSSINLVTSTGSLPQGGFSGAFLVTGLTAGSNTFTAKYRVDGGTGSFQNRTITVVPL